MTERLAQVVIIERNAIDIAVSLPVSTGLDVEKPAPGEQPSS
jgi:hypothetical protein